eukprot:sb/3462571/
MRMLELPKEEPYYRPFHIPIVRPRQETSGKPTFLHFPAEKEEEEEDLKKEPAPESKPSAERPKAISEPSSPEKCNVSIQTTKHELVDTSVQPEPGEVQPPKTTSQPSKQPFKTTSQLPLSENVSYQRTVNRGDVGANVMEQCKMLLESIQNSADELRKIKSQEPNKDVKQSAAQATEKDARFGLIKSSFVLDKNLVKLNPRPAQPARFLDVVDIPNEKQGGTHFQLRSSVEQKDESSKPGKEFIEVRDVSREKKKKKPPLSAASKPTKQSTKFKSPPPSPAVVSKSPTSPPPKVSHKPAVQPAPSPQHIEDDTLSSIGKYLSHRSISPESEGGKTIENEDHSAVSAAVNEDGEVVVSDRSSPRSINQDPRREERKIEEDDLIDKLLREEPEKHLDEILKPTDPGKYGEMIAETLHNLQEHTRLDRERELERIGRRLPITSRATPRSLEHVTKKPLNQQVVTSTPKPHKSKAAPPTKKCEPKETSQKKSNVMKPVRAAKYTPLEEVSIVSSDTSLPTNTEDLLKAALDSDTSSAVITPRPGGGTKKGTNPAVNTGKTGSKNQPPIYQKKVIPIRIILQGGSESKKELSEWMKKKRLARLQDFKKEREEKIRKEVKPFKASPTSQRRSTSGFDRKAAIMKRLNAAEDLVTDIKRKPQKIDNSTRTLGPRDRTQEWVEGLKVDDFDSIHSPSTLGSEHGASAITENISLP